jgi:hypothetical protein
MTNPLSIALISPIPEPAAYREKGVRHEARIWKWRRGGTHEEHDLSRLLINDDVPPRLKQRGASELDRQARADGGESDCDEAVYRVLDLW